MTVTFKHYTNQSIQEGGSLLGIFRSTDSESRALFIQAQSLLIAGQSTQIHFLHIFHLTPSPSRSMAATTYTSGSQPFLGTGPPSRANLHCFIVIQLHKPAYVCSINMNMKQSSLQCLFSLFVLAYLWTRVCLTVVQYRRTFLQFQLFYHNGNATLKNCSSSLCLFVCQQLQFKCCMLNLASFP